MIVSNLLRARPDFISEAQQRYHFMREQVTRLCSSSAATACSRRSSRRSVAMTPVPAAAARSSSAATAARRRSIADVYEAGTAGIGSRRGRGRVPRSTARSSSHHRPPSSKSTLKEADDADAQEVSAQIIYRL